MNAEAYGKAGGHRNPPLRLIIKVFILIDKNQNISYNINMIPATDGDIDNYEGTGVVIADRLGVSFWDALLYFF